MLGLGAWASWMGLLSPSFKRLVQRDHVPTGLSSALLVVILPVESPAASRHLSSVLGPLVLGPVVRRVLVSNRTGLTSEEL